MAACDTTTSYGTAQLRGNEYMRVTPTNLRASHKYTQKYPPVEDLQGLKLVQDFN